jgi:alpha-tubulin suppressor-like RCC1 family protein
MTAHTTVSASFALINDLVLTRNASNGTISANPQKALYTYGDEVTLTATPATGYRFTGWGGALSGTQNPATVTMTAHTTVSAGFTVHLPVPTGLRASFGIFPNRIEVDWDAVAEVTRYRLLRGETDNFTAAVVQAEPEVNYYDDFSANPEVNYYYWVQSVFGRDPSAAAGPVVGRRRDANRPEPPGAFSASRGLFPDKVRLEWTGVGTALHYEIFRAARPLRELAQVVVADLSVDMRTYDDAAPTGWTLYYWMTAVNTFGSSLWAGPVTGRAGNSLTWWGAAELQAQMPEAYAGAIQVELGRRHAVALLPDGRIGVWGDNAHGQQQAPAGLTGVVAVAAGYEHCLALRGDGTVLGWGLDGHGQASGGADMRHIAAIAGGGEFSLALRADGRVFAWGRANHGQTRVPANLGPVVMIAAGGEHALALQADGTVRAWGRNHQGQANVPPGLARVMAIAAGKDHSLALLEDGTVRGWGDNSRGQAPSWWGISNLKRATNGLRPMAGPGNVVSIAAGFLHSVLLADDGTVTTLGLSGGGAPVDNQHVAALAASDGISAALRREGTPAEAWISPAQVDVPPGARVTLWARGLATGERSYAWRRDGEPILGANQPYLTITGMRDADVAAYSVVISNAQGSLESEPAWLNLGGDAALAGYFPGFTAQAEDWAMASGIGRFQHAHFPWIHHRWYGWLHCAGWGGPDMHLYDPHGTGRWLWTTPGIFPHAWDVGAGQWVELQAGTPAGG